MDISPQKSFSEEKGPLEREKNLKSSSMNRRYYSIYGRLLRALWANDLWTEDTILFMEDF